MLSFQCVLVTQLCLTLCDPMDYNLPGSSVHGNLQTRLLELVTIPFSRGSSLTQGSNLGLLHCTKILYYLIHQGSQFVLHCSYESFVRYVTVNIFSQSVPCLFILLIEFFAE